MEMNDFAVQKSPLSEETRFDRDCSFVMIYDTGTKAFDAAHSLIVTVDVSNEFAKDISFKKHCRRKLGSDPSVDSI